MNKPTEGVIKDGKNTRDLTLVELIDAIKKNEDHQDVDMLPYLESLLNG